MQAVRDACGQGRHCHTGTPSRTASLARAQMEGLTVKHTDKHTRKDTGLNEAQQHIPPTREREGDGPTTRGAQVEQAGVWGRARRTSEINNQAGAHAGAVRRMHTG